MNAGFLSTLSCDYLQERINDKNKLYAKYKKKCKKVWLLIVADEFGISSTFSIDKSIFKHKYITPFHKVFLLKYGSNNLHELSISKIFGFKIIQQKIKGLYNHTIFKRQYNQS